MLIKAPQSVENCVKPLHFTHSAREAFCNILNAIDFVDHKKLLLPAYIGITDREGSGVFDPVELTGASYHFYTLDVNLAALKDELYELIKSEQYTALLIIHYFGFCQNNMTEIVALCKKHNVLLIEDCAHTMLSEVSEGQLGKLGDFSFYSFHKYLAVKEGGCLCVNNPDYYDLIRSKSASPPSLETLEIVLRSDLLAIREKRRSNYLELADMISDILDIEIMYPELPIGISPHNLPIIVKNDMRESLYFKLIDCGIPVIALYYRMIEPIMIGNFEKALYLSGSILNLPVHQDIEKKDLLFIKKELHKCYG